MASALASAAAGASNPFGLPLPRTARFGQLPVDTGAGGPNGYQLLTPPSTAQRPNAPAQTPVVPIPTTPATTPGAAGAPTPTVSTTFNLQTDPALQQVNALAGMSDEQANAQALKERQQQLLQYGDPRLAAAVLGQGDPTVQAAGQNQESDLAMLGRQRDQNLRQFDTQLDPSLVFSGYRVGQEQQLGQAYQDALAKAAAGVQGNLDSITGSLNSALSANNTNRINALGTAEANQIALALAGAGAGGTAPPVSAPPGDTTTPPPTDTTTPPPAGGNTGLDPNSPLGQLLLSGAVRPAVSIGARPMQAF